MRPATGQYLAAVFGTHALTETVLIHSFSSGWLKSPFHLVVVLAMFQRFFSGVLINLQPIIA
jgi:uncharacterized membrane protein